MNLVRVDARRVALAPPDRVAGVVARVVGGALATEPAPAADLHDPGLRRARAGRSGTEGDGLAGERAATGGRGAPRRVRRRERVPRDGRGRPRAARPRLRARSTSRGAARTEPRSRAACSVLPSGETATGEGAPTRARPTLSLVAQDFVGARRIFPEVTPVPRQVWYPVQSRRVRYFPNPGNNVTVQVRLAGQQPMVLALPGVGAQYIRQAYPDGGAPPTTMQGDSPPRSSRAASPSRGAVEDSA